MSTVDIILASASPRRRELLEQIGVRYQVLAIDIDEARLAGESPDQMVQRLALQKAQSGWEKSGGAFPVLAADTSINIDGQIFGKPRNIHDAFRILSTLCGRRHHVMTAVALYSYTLQAVKLSTSVVTLRDLSDQEITAYCKTNEPMDKAGAYAIQGKGAMFIQHLDGSYSGVMGLPLFETAELLRAASVKTLSETGK